jgi:hypothetical protein
MNKKFILPISLMLLVGLAVFVSASGTIISYPDKNGGLYDYQYELNLEKGWNLIAYGESFPFYMSEGYIGENLPIYQKIMDYINIPDINRKKADAPLFAYLYNPETNNYIKIFPDNEVGDTVTKSNYAMWVYVKEPTKVKYFAPNAPKLSDTKLINGWNFLAINPEMVGKSLNEIKGNCDWSKIYYYSTQKIEGSNWIDLLNNDNFVDEKLTESSVGMGMLIKINNNYCKLSSSSSGSGSLTTPPQIPGDNPGTSQTISINSVNNLNGGSKGSSFSGIIKTSESDGTYPEASKGFNIQVYMFSETPRETVFGGNAEYLGNGDWKIEGNYPNTAGSYDVQVSLSCASSDDDAVCRQVYGEIQKEYEYKISVN